jgi:hypothetical protein
LNAINNKLSGPKRGGHQLHGKIQTTHAVGFATSIYFFSPSEVADPAWQKVNLSGRRSTSIVKRNLNFV